MTLSACLISSRTESSTAAYPPAGVVGVGGSDADAPVTSVLSSSSLLPLSRPPLFAAPTLAAPWLGTSAPPPLMLAPAAAVSYFSHERMRLSGERELISADASVLMAGGFFPLRLPLAAPGPFPLLVAARACSCSGVALFSLFSLPDLASLCVSAALPAPSLPPSLNAKLELLDLLDCDATLEAGFSYFPPNCTVDVASSCWSQQTRVILGYRQKHAARPLHCQEHVCPTARCWGLVPLVWG